MSKQNSNFGEGPVWRCIINQSIPLIVAQLVLLLYNVVDRIYIGHLPGAGSTALTGIGLIFPLTTLIAAFTLLYGAGGTPLFSMARGRQDEDEAEQIMGNTFVLLILTSVALMAFCYFLKRPILYLFGASDATYVYADRYLKIYLIGTPFAMLTTGLNNFINAQGFPKVGMGTTLIGAFLNLILDPFFIFVLHMGVAGAALATIISQLVSALWVLRFLLGRRTLLRLRRSCLRLKRERVGAIVSLGLAGFIMQATNCLVQVACNATLKTYGGDVYVGIMTVINSVREILSLPVSGVTSGSQPVLSFNYGARLFDRVKKGIRFMTVLGVSYTVLAWVIVFLFPRFFITLFSGDGELIEKGIRALHIYFFGFFFMSFQFSGQSTFTSLGYAKHAIFFSLFRKAVIVAPLTVLLPRLGLGVRGVFLAEPISNAIGGLACIVTMYFVVYRRLGKNRV